MSHAFMHFLCPRSSLQGLATSASGGRTTIGVTTTSSFLDDRETSARP